jgi:hypothetical protein
MSNVPNLTEIRSVFPGLEQANGYGQPNVGADNVDTQQTMVCAEFTVSEKQQQIRMSCSCNIHITLPTYLGRVVSYLQWWCSQLA